MNLTRKDLQSKAIELITTHKGVILKWCTGLGKSKAAIDCIQTVVKLLPERIYKPNILLVIAEIAHKNNWQEEFIKWKLNRDDLNINIVTYASLKNYKHTNWDLVILDEAHHIDTDIRRDIMIDIFFNKLLCLSASIEESTSNYIQQLCLGDVMTHSVTLDEAITNNILAEPSIYLIPLDIRAYHTKTVEAIKEWGKKEKRKVIRCDNEDMWDYLKDKAQYPNVKLIITMTQEEYFYYLNTNIDYYKNLYFRTKNPAVKLKWLSLGSERKRFMGDLKTSILQTIIDKRLKDKRFICFCSSINQTEELHAYNSIHSKKKNVADIIESFNTKAINSLFAVGMLQEGQNLVDIQAGIIGQLDGNERPFVQKFGRAMRADNPVLYITYFKNTQDEVYLKNVLDNIDNKFIQKLNIKEL